MLRRLFQKRTLTRVAPERSTRELFDTAKRVRGGLRASLYHYNEDKYIVCGIAESTEFGDPVVLDIDASDEILGAALCDKLLAYTPRRKPSGHALDDWPAYRASGAKSGKAFEQASTFVYAMTVASAIRIEASPRVTNEKDLKAVCTASFTQMHIDIGAAVRKAIAASTALRDAKLL